MYSQFMKKKIMKQNSNAKNGFTLIELLIAMVILGILVAAGVPGMQTLLANMSIRSSTDNLVNSLAYARGEAAGRVRNVTICSSANGTTCGGNWADGWIVWSDEDGDSVLDPGEVIKSENISGSSVAIAGGGTIGFNNVGEGNAGGDVVFTLSKDHGTSKTITVYATGYARAR